MHVFKFHRGGPTAIIFLKLYLILKISNVAMQINAYQEDTKINTEVNKRLLQNNGTH